MMEDVEDGADDWADEDDGPEDLVPDGNSGAVAATDRSARGFVRTATERQGRVPYLLRAVIEARHRVAVAERQLDKGVRAARQHGATWEDIATALGMTRQGASKRFGGAGR
jgi:hypothetical protein